MPFLPDFRYVNKMSVSCGCFFSKFYSFDIHMVVVYIKIVAYSLRLQMMTFRRTTMIICG